MKRKLDRKIKQMNEITIKWIIESQKKKEKKKRKKTFKVTGLRLKERKEKGSRWFVRIVIEKWRTRERNRQKDGKKINKRKNWKKKNPT